MNKLCKRNCKILWQIMCFWQKSKNSSTTKHKIKHKHPFQRQELNLGPLTPMSDAFPLGHRLNSAKNRTQDLSHPCRMCYLWATDSTELIVIKLLNCLHAIGRNLNKQSQVCGPHIFNKLLSTSFVGPSIVCTCQSRPCKLLSPSPSPIIGQ